MRSRKHIVRVRPNKTESTKDIERSRLLGDLQEFDLESED